MLNDHPDGIRRAGLGGVRAELGESGKTEERAMFAASNCLAKGMFRIGGGYGVTQRVNFDGTEDVESVPVTVISGLPSSSAAGVPWKVLVEGSKESHRGIEDTR
jgi:hypothetical protein